MEPATEKRQGLRELCSSGNSGTPASNLDGQTNPATEPGTGSSTEVGTYRAFLSTTGAFNGSGLAVLSSKLGNISSTSTESDEEKPGNLYVFFQHYTGEIRWAQHMDLDIWKGGSVNEVVANDARNGTPISAIGARPSGVRQWHVFCTLT